MTPTSFDQLLGAARQEREPQRLLFVFVSAELPADATEAERQRFEENGGGSLKPVLCVDKLPEELRDFAALRESPHVPAWPGTCCSPLRCPAMPASRPAPTRPSSR